MRLHRQVRRRHGRVGGAHDDPSGQQHDDVRATGGTDTPEVEALVLANCARTGATLVLTDDVVEAVEQADAVFTVGWWWMQPVERREVRRILRPYQVNEALWAHARPGAKFMHCLPAIRGEEMTDAMLDGRRRSSSTRPRTASTSKRRCCSR